MTHVLINPVGPSLRTEIEALEIGTTAPKGWPFLPAKGKTSTVEKVAIAMAEVAAKVLAGKTVDFLAEAREALSEDCPVCGEHHRSGEVPLPCQTGDGV